MRRSTSSGSTPATEESREELNLYIIGEGGEEDGAPGAEDVPAAAIAPEPDEPKELS